MAQHRDDLRNVKKEIQIHRQQAMLKNCKNMAD